MDSQMFMRSNIPIPALFSGFNFELTQLNFDFTLSGVSWREFYFFSASGFFSWGEIAEDDGETVFLCRDS